MRLANILIAAGATLALIAILIIGIYKYYLTAIITVVRIFIVAVDSTLASLVTGRLFRAVAIRWIRHSCSP